MLVRLLMKISSISIFILTILSVFPYSLTQAQTEDLKSTIQVDTSDYSFGSVLEGEKIKTSFNISNTGNAPLNIINLIPGCGCLIAKLDSQVVEPGGNLPVSVEFDTRGFIGQQSQQLAINTDNLEQKQLVFTIHGQVEPEVMIEPNRIFISQISAKELIKLPTIKFKVTVNSKSKAEITELLDLSQLLEISDLQIAPKKATFLTKYLTPEKPGLYRDRLSINLKNASRKNYNVPVFIKVQEPLEIIPPALSFGLLKPGSETTKILKLKFPKEMGLKITEVNSENLAISAIVQTGKSKDDSISLQVSIDPSAVKESILTDLVLTTNQEELKEIRVNVFATVPPRIEEP